MHKSGAFIHCSKIRAHFPKTVNIRIDTPSEKRT